jgi:DNA-binding NarL/FixJ family response regulator
VLFESLWERALAVPGIEVAEGSTEGASGRRLLLDQLAAGAKDEQIARTLGMSLRTVRRRVAQLLDELGAESRFQAGVEAVRRGWL